LKEGLESGEKLDSFLIAGQARPRYRRATQSDGTPSTGDLR
jgi:hypothetical protein